MRLDGWTIVFDLDGTLAETMPDLVAAVNAVIAQDGLVPLGEEAARPYVGRGAKFLMRMALFQAGATFSEERLDALTEAMVAHYQHNIAVHTRLFPGVQDLLDDLSRRGAALAIATNKRGGLARKLIAELELQGVFAAICGADDVSARKPEAAHLLETIAMAGGERGKAVMIGDSGPDAYAAESARLPCLLYAWGYSETPATQLPQHGVFDHFGQAGAMIDALVQAGSQRP